MTSLLSQVGQRDNDIFHLIVFVISVKPPKTYEQTS